MFGGAFRGDTMKRHHYAVMFLVLAAGATGTTSPLGAQRPLPDIICHADRVLWINHREFRTQEFTDPSTTYRIQDGKLYIADDGRPEYNYNTVTAFGDRVAGGMLRSGHFTFISLAGMVFRKQGGCYDPPIIVAYGWRGVNHYVIRL